MFYSRVLNQKYMFNSDYLGEEIVNLLDRSFILPADFDAATYKVTDEYVARPDLLAHDIYGDEMYAEIICKINGISNPYELNEDDLLIVPDVNIINDFIKWENTAWTEKDSVPTSDGSLDELLALMDGKQQKPKGPVKPIPATKNKKRKPNQAVVGDKRFNIDPISKIVIY